MGLNEVQIRPAEMCAKHQKLLLQQANYGPKDSWQVLLVVAQIALFQKATTKPNLHDRIGDDITRIHEVGCLACYSPDAFGEIVTVAKSHDISKIKELGESWLKDVLDKSPDEPL